MEVQEKSLEKSRPHGRPGFSVKNRQRLKALRIAAGLTFDELAQGTGYDATTLCRCENGNRLPTPRLLAAWTGRLQAAGPRKTVAHRKKSSPLAFSEAMRSELKGRRLALGLTFAQLADGTGYALTTFSGVENGNDAPSRRLLATWNSRLESLEGSRRHRTSTLPKSAPQVTPADKPSNSAEAQTSAELSS